MPNPVIGAVGGGLGSAIIGSRSASKAASAQASAANEQARVQREMFNRMDELQGELSEEQKRTNLTTLQRAHAQGRELFDRAEGQTGLAHNRAIDRLTGSRDVSLDAIRSAQGRNRETLQLARDASFADVNRTERANISDLRGARDASFADVNRTERSILGDIEGARDRAIEGYAPYQGAGQNALEAYAYNLGVGGRPQGYAGLEMTPGAQFLLERGRDTVEGGAAGAGGLYSGATLEALENMRSGIVATDRDNQMGQLNALAGYGLNATNAVAGLERGFSSDLTGVRSGAADARIGLRTGFANDAGGVRTGASGARTGLRTGFADADTANTAWGTQQANATRLAYNPMMVNQVNATADRRIGNATNLANMNTGARSAFSQNEGARRVNRANLFGSAATNYANGASNALANFGNARAAGAVGVGNALSGGIEQGLNIYGMMGGRFGGTGSSPMSSGNWWQGLY